MSKKDDKIVEQAQKRFRACEAWESEARVNFAFDTKFANGDSTNMWQWPVDIVNERNRNSRPCLTINKVRQHCLQIINDQRQNQSQIEVRPVGNGASYEAAKVFEGVVRHIENISNAQAAYGNACFSQVIGGIGYWRVLTDYAHDDSFDQEIYIKRVQDALSVYLDPDIEQADGSDARYAFVFRDMPLDDFKAEYPEHEDIGHDAPLGSGSGSSWQTEEHIRVCEYYRKVDSADKLHELYNGNTVRESDYRDADMLDGLKQNSVKSRDITTPKIEWFLIAGSKIIDKKDYAGTLIPIVRVIGEETIIDKQLDRRGHVRSMLDAQRMYNVWSSAATEFAMLQTKTPYIAAVEAIGPHEESWANSNLENAAYLPYNGFTENGTKIDKPERNQPPVMAPAYLHGMEMAKSELMMASGQYESSFGQKSNEISGVAINQRQRQGENATYHFIDRFAQAIRYTGRILIDLIPKIYDTKRVIKILAIDGDESTVQCDPNHPQSHSELQNKDDDDFSPESVSAIFNPSVGKYSVFADVGPNFASRRQDTFNAISQLLKSDANLTPLISDLLFKAADFPYASEIAERLYRMVPPKALDGEQPPDPMIAQLQQHLAQQHQVMVQQGQELAAAKAKQMDVEQKTSIATYDAETRRLVAVGNVDPDGQRVIFRQLMSEVLGQPANPIVAAHAYEHAEMQAQQASIMTPPGQDQAAQPTPQAPGQ